MAILCGVATCVLIEVAGEVGPDLAPQKMKLPLKLDTIWDEKICKQSSRDRAVCLHFNKQVYLWNFCLHIFSSHIVP